LTSKEEDTRRTCCISSSFISLSVLATVHIIKIKHKIITAEIKNA